MSLQPQNKWDILIISVLHRHDSLNRLLADLYNQKQGFPDVNIITLIDDVRLPRNEKRNLLTSISEAEYISFIDDDDEVPDDFIATIYPLLDGVDYIGWQMQHYNKDVASKPTFHSIKYKGWYEDGDGYYRDISHLNPIKRSIANKFMFDGVMEDYNWAQEVGKSGLVQTEHYIDKVMYHYRFDPDKTLTKGE